MLKKILVYNHKFQIHVQKFIIPFGMAMSIVIGASMLAGSFPNIDFNEYPLWMAYLLVSGGFLTFLSYAVDLIVGLITGLKITKRKSYKDRIKDAGG